MQNIALKSNKRHEIKHMKIKPGFDKFFNYHLTRSTTNVMIKSLLNPSIQN
mgnify:CR=1 FL=1